MGPLCRLGALGGQKMVLETLKLELWIVVDHTMGAGNSTQVIYESNTSS